MHRAGSHNEESAAFWLLEPAVSSSMRANAYMGFHLTRMLVRTKSTDRHIGACPTSMYLCVPDSCARSGDVRSKLPIAQCNHVSMSTWRLITFPTLIKSSCSSCFLQLT
ncbi:hypothetical protein BDR07DRAFT_517199 [Suillus spraguei]|nr:hypothetical protein BDR07DRAFT_517199 [Suillus spraguei]